MARPYPLLNTASPIVQGLLKDFEKNYTPHGLDEEEGSTKREFWKAGLRCLVRHLARKVLAGEWNMGTTQTAVAQHLGLDHSSMNDALWKGEMSNITLVALLCSSERPNGQWPTPEVIAAMNRSGFIAAAKHLARLVHDRPALKPDKLNEFQYELMGEVLARFSKWPKAVTSGNDALASEIIEEVSTKDDVIPFWYRDEKLAQVQEEIKTFGNAKTALADLNLLQRTWADIFVATTFVTQIGVRYA